MGFGSIGGEFHFPNAQLSQCGFFCNTIQSQTPIVCISNSGQSCFSDRRIINELEFSSCICVSTINSDTLCTSQDTSVSVSASVAQLDARPTGDQEIVGSTPAEVGNILSWRLIMKYFLRSFSPFR